MSNHSIKCVKCGHKNYAVTEPVEVKVSDLLPSDKGLRANIGDYGYGNVLILSSGPNRTRERDHLFEVEYFDPNINSLFEPNSGTRFFYDAEETVTVWRPVN